MNELLKQIGIDAEPVKGENGSYNIDIEDSNEYGRYFSKLWLFIYKGFTFLYVQIILDPIRHNLVGKRVETVYPMVNIAHCAIHPLSGNFYP